jgi:predicted alpha/beta superfamily hydrolase
MRRLLLLVAFLAFPTFAQEPAVIRIESKVMGETRQILVRTPASYATGSQKYPVLYMTDGDRQLPHTAATVDFLSREGRMPEVIVVGISNTDRTRDLTPTHVETLQQDGRTLQFPTSGGGAKFLSFIETEVIPYVEKNYRTQPYRVFAGHSFGGLFALQSLFTRPRLFNAVIAVSPALVWDDRWVFKRATELVEQHPELNTTLVVSTGNESEGLDREFRALQSLFKGRKPKGFEFEAIKFEDEDHGSVVMPAHYASLSKRAGFTVPIPEQTTNFIAYQLLLAGKLPEAIEAFKANAAAYPASANVYDSLGEAYERAGDSQRARENYARAAEIGKKINDPNTSIYERNLQRVGGRP